MDLLPARKLTGIATVGPTCSCKKQNEFLTALLIGGPSHASAQGPSAP